MSRLLHALGVTRIAGRLLGCSIVLAASPAAAPEFNPWSKGRQWLSVRFGYARSAAEGAADGNLGFGFGYQRFHDAKWSYGAHAHLDVLGRFGDAAEIEVPWTVELTRHFKWNTVVHPYTGLGGGLYYNKVSGTGDDHAGVKGGFFMAGGANTPVSDHGLLGLDVRMNLVSPEDQLNPVFGNQAVTGRSQSRVVHWGAKINYAWVF